eukprot:TRINITY_DN3870_c0_g1_i1.p1 TRINITY_DN3870_c0_g1~~TRINITY_DN3870_c0_g1_i1.p1  ORF type:complete len:1057 (+),score=210.59 TRINITY_DN3870_c0_g1_i1:81-3173(+)
MDSLLSVFPNEEEMIREVMSVMTAQHAKQMGKSGGNFDQAASAGMTPFAISAQAVGNLILKANSNSMHKAGQHGNSISNSIRVKVCQLVGAPPAAGNTLFTDGGAHANEFVLRSLLPRNPKKLGGGLLRDVILIGAIEHPSLMDRAIQLSKETDYVLEIVPIDSNTGVYQTAALEELAQKYRERVALLSLHHANNEIGTIQPITECGTILKSYSPSSLYHVDCIQTLGKVAINLQESNVDVASVSFHKVGGPKRCGALVTTKIGLFPDSFKATIDVASHLSGILAAEVAIQNMRSTAETCAAIRSKITSGLQQISEAHNVTYRELSSEQGVPGICTFLFPGMQGRHIVSMLSDQGVNISSGAACSSQNDEPSKVISNLRISSENYFSAVRFSFGSDITVSDVEDLLTKLAVILEKLQPAAATEILKRQYGSDRLTGKPKTINEKIQKRIQTREARLKAAAAETAESAEAVSEQAPMNTDAEHEVVKEKRNLSPTEAEVSETKRPKEDPPRRLTRKEKKAKKVPEVIEPVNLPPDDEIIKIFKETKEEAGHEFNAIMVTFGEIVLKGSNRKQFEKTQYSNLYTKLASHPVTSNCVLWEPVGYPSAGFVLVMHVDDAHRPADGIHTAAKGSKKQIPMPNKPIAYADYHQIIVPLLREVPGIATMVALKVLPKKWDLIRDATFKTFQKCYETQTGVDKNMKCLHFGMSSRRSCKKFPLSTGEINRALGSNLVVGTEACKYDPPLLVNLSNPTIKIEVRIRDDCALVFSQSNHYKGIGGLPDGADADAKVLGLLSGGHDSPIACQLTMKRGCRLSFVHFDGYPYVGKEVVLKIRKLQQHLNKYQSVPGLLYCVPFAGIQEIIAKTKGVAPGFRTILYRIYMFRIASALCRKHGFISLCTGDNIGQVASQTLTNMSVLDSYAEDFVIRPLITAQKTDIISACEQLGLFDITKLYGTADCCTVFKPENPILKVQKRDLERILARLDEAGINDAITKAVDTLVVYSSDDVIGELPATTGPAACPYDPNAKPAEVATS